MILKLITKEKMQDYLNILREKKPRFVTQYKSIWGADCIKREYKWVTLYTYVFPYATYRIIKWKTKSVTDCYDYALSSNK